MATLRNIKRRIDSVRSTQQITKAMKMVAAAKLRKAQNRLHSARPYAKELQKVLADVAGRSRKKIHPLLEPRRGEKTCYVLVTADRGLCGSFNANLIRRAMSEYNRAKANERYLITVGRKGYDFFRKHGIPILAHHNDIFNSLEFSSAQVISTQLREMFLEKKFDRIYLIYNEFKSAMQQKIEVEQFLPITPPSSTPSYGAAGFIYEPGAEQILKELCPLTLNIHMWRVLLESNASELGARMTAMETASENAEDMINELVLYYNKTRQAAITNELNEIVGGAEALRG